MIWLQLGGFIKDNRENLGFWIFSSLMFRHLFKFLDHPPTKKLHTFYESCPSTKGSIILDNLSDQSHFQRICRYFFVSMQYASVSCKWLECFYIIRYSLLCDLLLLTVTWLEIEIGLFVLFLQQICFKILSVFSNNYLHIEIW